MDKFLLLDVIYIISTYINLCSLLPLFVGYTITKCGPWHCYGAIVATVSLTSSIVDTVILAEVNRVDFCNLFIESIH